MAAGKATVAALGAVSAPADERPLLAAGSKVASQHQIQIRPGDFLVAMQHKKIRAMPIAAAVYMQENYPRDK
jgi:hypothetical protein